MLSFKDFVPDLIKEGGLLSSEQWAGVDNAVVKMNAWLKDANVKVQTIETVVLPNIWKEDGTGDAHLRQAGEYSSYWYQVVRVWYWAS
jgi:hypothetical protein